MGHAFIALDRRRSLRPCIIRLYFTISACRAATWQRGRLCTRQRPHSFSCSGRSAGHMVGSDGADTWTPPTLWLGGIVCGRSCALLFAAAARNASCSSGALAMDFGIGSLEPASALYQPAIACRKRPVALENSAGLERRVGGIRPVGNLYFARANDS